MILGIDFGYKRVGLALSDLKGEVVIPFKTIVRKDEFTIKPVVAEIKQIVKDKNIQKMILGYPLNLDKTKSSLTIEVESFRERLYRNIKKIEIILFEEHLTSAEAYEILKAKNKNIKKGEIDMVAATLILQDYLNSKTKENNG